MSVAKVKFASVEVQVKSSAAGQVTAILAELDKVDHDGDLYTAETFTEGAELAISPYNHSTMYGTTIPVGKGVLHVEQSYIWVEAQYFLENETAREAFTVVKQMGASQQWSWGFKAIDAEPIIMGERQVNLIKKAEVFEASPVVRGASIGSRTMTAKEAEAQAEAAAILARYDVRQQVREERARFLGFSSAAALETHARAIAMAEQIKFIRSGIAA
jgi:hypothetical protein